MTTPQAASYWLDRVKEEAGVGSDYKLSALLCVARAAVSQQRSGKTSLSAETAIRIGWILGVHPLEVLGSASAATAKTEDARNFWLQVMAKYSDQPHL